MGEGRYSIGAEVLKMNVRDIVWAFGWGVFKFSYDARCDVRGEWRGFIHVYSCGEFLSGDDAVFFVSRFEADTGIMFDEGVCLLF